MRGTQVTGYTGPAEQWKRWATFGMNAHVTAFIAAYVSGYKECQGKTHEEAKPDTFP